MNEGDTNEKSYVDRMGLSLTADVVCRIRTSEGISVDSPETYFISVSPNCTVATTPEE
jgi:hypothetical protein